MMNVKYSKQQFQPCHENEIVKMIPIKLKILCGSFQKQFLYFGLEMESWSKLIIKTWKGLVDFDKWA